MFPRTIASRTSARYSGVQCWQPGPLAIGARPSHVMESGKKRNPYKRIIQREAGFLGPLAGVRAVDPFLRAKAFVAASQDPPAGAPWPLCAGAALACHNAGTRCNRAGAPSTPSDGAMGAWHPWIEISGAWLRGNLTYPRKHVCADK